MEVDNIATIKDLIRKDLGVSILARSACMDELRKGKLTALPIENLSMVTPDEPYLSQGLPSHGTFVRNFKTLPRYRHAIAVSLLQHVGVDAVFTGIFGEFVTSLGSIWALPLQTFLKHIHIRKTGEPSLRSFYHMQSRDRLCINLPS